MFYKRISDLHPLGKPNGTDWSDLKPIQIDDSTTEERLSVVLDEPSTVNYKIPSQKISHPASNNINESVLPHLKPEFAKDFWWETSSETTDMISGKIIESTITNPQEISANNFLKSLWIETAIAKNKDNKPTSRKNKISKYQSKRMNAYNFLNFSPFDVDVSEVHAQCIIAKSANSSGNLTANVIFSDIAKLENVFSKYCELSSLSVNSISSNALSATIGAFDSLSGGDGYYNKTQFNVLSSTEICAQNAHITKLFILYCYLLQRLNRFFYTLVSQYLSQLRLLRHPGNLRLVIDIFHMTILKEFCLCKHLSVDIFRNVSICDIKH